MSSDRKPVSDLEAPGRAEYLFKAPLPLSRAQADFVCQAVLDVIRPALGYVTVDAFTDYRDEITEHTQAAENGLRGLGVRQRPRREPGLAVEIDPQEDEQWAWLRAYAAWSINVEMWEENHGRSLGTFHDCADLVVTWLTPQEFAALSETVARFGVLVATAQIVASHKEGKRQRRAGRRRLLTAWLRRMWPG